MRTKWCKNQQEKFFRKPIIVIRQKGIDQKQLAIELNISPASVTHWIKGNKYPRIGKIEEIAEYFNVPMSRLTQDQDKEIQQDTLAAHLDGDFTEEELIEIRKYAELVRKAHRNN